VRLYRLKLCCALGRQVFTHRPRDAVNSQGGTCRYQKVIPGSRLKLPALTGLRAIAAFWVLMLHFGDDVTANWPVALRRLFSSGFIGVDLFFVLSGFILSWNYLNDTGLSCSSRDFWRARAARILPVYYGSLALALPVFLVMQFNHGITPEAIRHVSVTAAFTLSLTQSWALPFSYLWNTASWSLSVEVFLYLSFPWLAVWLARRPLRSVLQTTALLYGATVLAALLFFAFHSHPSPWTWDPAPDMCIWIPWLGSNPVVHFHEFLMGAAAYLFLRAEQTGARKEWISGPQAVWISSAGVLALLAWRGPVPFMAALMGLYSPLFALLIYGLAKQQGVVAQILSTRGFVFLGEISFALYLAHLTVWDNMVLFNVQHSYIQQDSALNFLICVALSVAVATLFYKFIEVPYRKTLRAKWKTAATLKLPEKLIA